MAHYGIAPMLRGDERRREGGALGPRSPRPMTRQSAGISGNLLALGAMLLWGVWGFTAT